MITTPDTQTVKELLELRRNNMLAANPEYQRGRVWTEEQKKKLVDSVLRGYPIPLIYLHHIERKVGNYSRNDFEIIDGQQRLTALWEFSEGGFELFDPVEDDEDARFPAFIKAQPCPWGGKDIHTLDPAVREKFEKTPLSIVMIQTDVPNEARDLFIRLQAGMPLNSQEKRDAWPGDFTDYVLRIGGKSGLAKYPGHDFFRSLVKVKSTDRGEVRQLAAQMAMLYYTHRDSEGERLCSIDKESVDTFYYKNLDFNTSSDEAKRYEDILKLLVHHLHDGKRKRLQGHEAIHLMLLIDSLYDEYTLGWTKHFAKAFDDFRTHVATDTKSDPQGEYYYRYGQWTRASTDRADTIARRHEFFAQKMYEWTKPVPKDPTRAFGELERELIYARDKKRCQECDADVPWADAEIHHVEMHAKGGKTTLENGALMHKKCHPKSAAAVAAFAAKWKTKFTSAAAAAAAAPSSSYTAREELDNGGADDGEDKPT